MIPKEVSERWAPMWPVGHHPDRPWWAILSTKARTAAGQFVTWRRVDGLTKSAPWTPVTEAWGSSEQLQAAIMLAAVAATGDALTRIDREHPLPAPPPMPGQVWVREGDEVQVPSLVPSQKSPWIVTWPLVVQGVEVDPAKGWILVYGPAPWGPNMPWMDTRA